MAIAYAFSISGRSLLKPREFESCNTTFNNAPQTLKLQRKSNQLETNHHKLIVRAYDEESGGGGGDFVLGFVLGGAVCGTLAYIFAPQIRRTLLNEDEYGFRKAKGPVYYDEGLERTRQTLNAKITQLNSAIDNVSSRLRGSNNPPPAKDEPQQIESDPEVETTI